MAVCPSCGFSKFRLLEAQCLNCRKPGCERCLQGFGRRQMAPGQEAVTQWVCSRACFEQWTTRMIGQGFSPVLWGASWAMAGTILAPAYAALANQMAERHRANLRLQHAQNLLTGERFEDAAKVYEGLGMWREAGEARRRGNRKTVTQVQVDVNSLIEQVRKGGLTTTYSCPACRSPIRIDSTADAGLLQHCQYCGTAIQSTDLVDFLSRVVGYR